MPRATQHLNLHTCGQQAIDSTTPEALPDIACRVVILKNPIDNTGIIYFRKDDGTTLDATNGYGLSAGEESPVLWVGNANEVVLLAGVDEESVYYLTYH